MKAAKIVESCESDDQVLVVYEAETEEFIRVLP